MKRLSLKSKVSTKISRSKREVFLRSDFKNLAGYDQIGRALRQLTSEGALLKIGYGLYAKARPNRITGQPMLSAEGGFSQVSQEALSRLGVKWQPSESVQAYQAGSTQIPANAEVIILERFNRRIGTEKFELQMARA
ncbi:MAG: conjugal transfer protein [Oleispira sp.]|nr:conjugal transfer protein [Oleispira sp.]